jgi:predicted P-loop ATPase
MEDIKKEKIWISWKLVQRPDDTKPTKVPIQKDGQFASSTDPKTWATFDEVGENKGVIFEPTVGIVGVDFDHCIDADGNITNEQIGQFVASAKTYVEYSPSKTGLHLLFRSTERIDLEANKHHFNDTESVEAYTWGRYFTFTGNEHPDSKPLLEVDSDIFTMLLAQLGYPWKKVTVPTILTNGGKSHLSKEDILTKMFASKNGEKMKRLYDGNLQDYHNDNSNADLNLCLSLAFWSNRDYQMMKDIWLASPLGQRKKTQERTDYQDRTLNRAIEYTTDTYQPPSRTLGRSVDEDEDIDYEFVMTKVKDDFIPSMIGLNINRVLRKHPQFIGKFRRNTFSHMVETNYNGGDWEALTDGVILKVREFIAENFSFFSKLSSQMVQEALLTVSEDNRVNPPRDYFSSLVWDGQPRLNSWLHQTYGVADDELHQQIGSNWMKGLVKRVMQPGCQFDHVLVLVSGQGMRKSTSIRVLGEPWHVETTHSTDNKDFYLLLAQNVIVEFSEGEILDRTSVKKLKAEITKTEDQIRPPYERGIIRMKRSCVFAVTTNELEFKDSTGNRRWLPVELLKTADIDWLQENKEQLYAEAYHRVIVANESVHIFSDELGRVQDRHLEWSDYDEKVVNWISGVPNIEEDGVMLHDAIRSAYGQNIHITGLEEKRVSGTLRGLLKMESRNKRVGDNVRKRWFPTEKTMEIINNSKQYNDF